PASTARTAKDWLRFHVGPLPFNLATSEPTALRDLAAELGVGTIFIDSLKDVATDLSSDESGGRVNIAFQHVLAAGIELCLAHHQRKSGGTADQLQTLDDVYGSTWIASGAGSVIGLVGEPGDPIVRLRHLKQPLDEVGPFDVAHDHDRGTTSLLDATDPLQALRDAGEMTAQQLAVLIYGRNEPTRNEVQRARRKLDRMAEANLARRREGAGPKAPVTYLAVQS
ncbi:MAG TPA: hypothetical protein VNT60_08570, partial [Deinococcales bacterium]|nr:hypothetical protein [Deinococcales bacterium]